MTTTDAAGNLHRPAGTPGSAGGQFTAKQNRAPAGDLAASGPQTLAQLAMASFDRASAAAREQQRALRAPAVAAAEALLREKYPDATAIHLFVDWDGDESFVSIDGVKDADGNAIELDPDDEGALDEVFRAVAVDFDDLSELPRAEADGPQSVRIPVRPKAEEYLGISDLFYEATRRDDYDNDLAGAALRETASALLPDAVSLKFGDGGDRIYFTGYVDEAGAEHSMGFEDGETFDDIDTIVMTMSGQGNTGGEITGMSAIDSVTLTFPIKEQQ